MLRKVDEYYLSLRGGEYEYDRDQFISPDGTFSYEADSREYDEVEVRWSDMPYLSEHSLHPSGESYASWLDEIEIYIGCDSSSDCEGGVDCVDGFCGSGVIPGECGNGIINTGEECDDGGNDDGDGCDANCEVEDGWYCIGEPSDCYPEEPVDGEECEDFTTKQLCWASSLDCTWTPPGTVDIFDGGHCCPAEQEWDLIYQQCGGTDNFCYNGLFKSQEFPIPYNKTNNYGPGLDHINDIYCAQVIKGTDYGFWYPVEVY
jgi:cysteine-rich repeat protein